MSSAAYVRRAASLPRSTYTRSPTTPGVARSSPSTWRYHAPTPPCPPPAGPTYTLWTHHQSPLPHSTPPRVRTTVPPAPPSPSAPHESRAFTDSPTSPSPPRRPWPAPHRVGSA